MGNSKNDYYNVQSIDLNDNLLAIANILKDIKQPKISQLASADTDGIKDKAKYIFLENSFDLTFIPFIPYDLLQKLEIICKNKELDLDSFIELTNNYLSNLNPFDIPILFDNSLGFEGGYCNPLYLGKNGNIQKLIFTEFILTGKFSILTPGIYSHEIVHSQLEINKGVNNYIHSEVLPMFFDKLTSLYLNDNFKTLKVNEQLRFIRLFKTIDKYSSESLSLYQETKLSMGIISILESEILFDKYLYGTNNDKVKIISEINDVLLGNKQVENLLQQNNITINNCQDKKFIKRKVNSLL